MSAGTLAWVFVGHVMLQRMDAFYYKLMQLNNIDLTAASEYKFSDLDLRLNLHGRVPYTVRFIASKTGCWLSFNRKARTPTT